MNKTDEYKCKMFTKGKTVWHFGQAYVVDHITVRGNQLFVNFEGGVIYVPDYQIDCELTTISLIRKEM
jgi:hypothetical protein